MRTCRTTEPVSKRCHGILQWSHCTNVSVWRQFILHRTAYFTQRKRRAKSKDENCLETHGNVNMILFVNVLVDFSRKKTQHEWLKCALSHLQATIFWIFTRKLHCLPFFRWKLRVASYDPLLLRLVWTRKFPNEQEEYWWYVVIVINHSHSDKVGSSSRSISVVQLLHKKINPGLPACRYLHRYLVPKQKLSCHSLAE